MFQLERQVLRTYTTWKWIWLMLPLALLMMLLAAMNSVSHQNDDGSLSFSSVFGIGMPIMTCMHWFASVAKWQFADPRARLIPGYTRPHLLVIFAVLTMFLVANPLLQAFCQDISPLGPVAFALLLGGSFLCSIHFNRGIYALPAIVVFFSGMYPGTSPFWFSRTSDFQAIHVIGILLGATMVVWWLWKLATLHEEDDGYFITPLGAAGSLSRLERVLQGRLQGRKAARGGLANRFSDRWHNRLFTFSGSPTLTALSQYGWDSISHGHRAASFGGGFAIFWIVTSLWSLWLHQSFSAPGLAVPALMVVAAPAIGAAILLRSRRVRMASELLRPASRTAYLDGLFKSLVKSMLYLWLVTSAGLWVMLMASKTTFIRGDFTQLTAGYLLLSLAVQLPAFALGLRMARWRSTVLFALSCYGLGILEMSLLLSCFHLQKEAGPISIAVSAAVLLIGVGLPLLIQSRNHWLRAELG